MLPYGCLLNTAAHTFQMCLCPRGGYREGGDGSFEVESWGEDTVMSASHTGQRDDDVAITK